MYVSVSKHIFESFFSRLYIESWMLFTSASILHTPGNTSGLRGLTNALRAIAWVTTSMCSWFASLWQMPLTDPSST